MLRGLARADKNYRHVQAVTLLERRIVIHIHFPQRGAEFAQERRNRRLRLLAEMTAWTGVKRHIPRAGVREALVFGMKCGRRGHGFGLEYFWNAPE